MLSQFVRERAHEFGYITARVSSVSSSSLIDGEKDLFSVLDFNDVVDGFAQRKKKDLI